MSFLLGKMEIQQLDNHMSVHSYWCLALQGKSYFLHFQILCGSSLCLPSTTADVRVSRQKDCHYLETQIFHFIFITHSERFVLSPSISCSQLRAVRSHEGHLAMSRESCNCHSPVSGVRGWSVCGEGSEGDGLLPSSG